MLLNRLFRILIVYQLFYKIYSADNKWSRLQHPLTSTELSLTRASGSHRVKNATNLVKLAKDKVHFSCKALLEFNCKNGNCIQYSKFCDGANDCGDFSDEFMGCTKCNQTIYGEIGQKYPLRLTEPVQKFHPFLCEITFSAIGGKFGDIIELTFLSFQVGSFHIKKKKSNCENGFLKISEKALLEIGKGREEGKLCGQLMSRKAIFYSRGNNVSLTISLSEGRGFYGQYLPLNVYLTYRYLGARSIYNTLGKSPRSGHYLYFSVDRSEQVGPLFFLLDFRTDFGIKLSGSNCDRVFEDCLPPRKCSIISPNYPGFYPRNVTCKFLIQQTHRIPKGYRARISINQSNEYKISLFAGSSSTAASGSKAKKGLLFDCELDLITIYDGSATNARKLLDFCGSGQLPPVLSSKSEILVVLKSGAHNVLFDSRFQLDVQVVLHKELDASRTNVCDFVYKGANVRSGVIKSQAVLSNVTCYYKFVSNNVWDRIWIYFVSYLVQDSKQWANEEKCEYSQMTISDSGNITFCEKSSPKICGRVFEGASYNSKAPCLYPQESYLSSGPQMTISQTHYQLSNIYYTPSHFTAKFEFIDTQEFGEPIIGTLCDRRFASYKYPGGFVRSTRNLFYYGRGGQRSISCSYHFLTNLNQRLRLSIAQLKLNTTNCNQTRNSINNSYQCQFGAKNAKKRSTLIIFESMNSERLYAGCFCNSISESSLLFETIGSEVVLNFTATEMSSDEDFNDFGFEANFEFLPGIDCDLHAVQKRNEKEAEITFTVPSNYDFSSKSQLICRWTIPAFPGSKQLDLKVSGYKRAREDDCDGSNRYIIYSGNPWRPLVIICAHLMAGRGDEDLEEIHLSWPIVLPKAPEILLPDSDTFAKGTSLINQSTSQLQAIIEIRARKHGSFNFKWLQLSDHKEDTTSSQLMRKTDCIYKCPELNVCLSPDLMCDGTTHCPSGYDENKHICAVFPTFWIVLICSLLFLLVSLLLLLFISRRRKRLNTPVSSSSIPVSRQEIDSREDHLVSHRSEYQATHEFNFRFKTEELGLESIIDGETCYYSHHCPTLGRVYR